MNLVIVYHANCADGSAAAYLIQQAVANTHPLFAQDYEMIVTIPAQYNDAHHRDLFGLLTAETVVYYVDYCDDQATLEHVLALAKNVTVIDHHATKSWIKEWEEPNLTVVFDETRSGAALTYKYLYPEEMDLPWWVAYVEDRDLWKFELDNSKEVSEYFRSEPLVPDRWHPDQLGSWQDAVRKGRELYHELRKEVNSLVKRFCRNKNVVIGDVGYNVDLVELPDPGSTRMTSEIGERVRELNTRADFTVISSARGSNQLYVVSLRAGSCEEDHHLGEIAQTFSGGGGHKNAAGFALESERYRQIFHAES